MIGRRRCPQCAERVRREALVCRYCNSELPKQESSRQSEGVKRAQMLGGGAVLVALGALAVAYSSFRQLSMTPIQSAKAPSVPFEAVAATHDFPVYPTLAVGETLAWTAESSFEPVNRQAGP